jgi:hypothetical protein
LGLDNKQTASLMSLDLGSKQQTYGVDIRDTAIHWINDIEKVKILQLTTSGFNISHLLW